jgi:hypothetical protein
MAGTQLIMIEVARYFPQALQNKVGIVPQTGYNSSIPHSFVFLTH